MKLQYKAGLVVALVVLLLIVGVAIKFALWRTMFAYGTSMFLFGLTMLFIACAVVLLTLRSRRVSS